MIRIETAEHRSPWEILAELIRQSEHRQAVRRAKETAKTIFEVFHAIKRRKTLEIMENSAGVPHAKLDNKHFPRGFAFWNEFRNSFERKPSDRERVEFVREFLNNIFSDELERPWKDFRAERFFRYLCVALASSPHAEEIFLAEGKKRRERERANEKAWIKWLKNARARSIKRSEKMRRENLSPAEVKVLNATTELNKIEQEISTREGKLEAVERKKANAERKLLRLLKKAPPPPPTEELTLQKKPRKPRTPEQAVKHRHAERVRTIRQRVERFKQTTLNERALTSFRKHAENVLEPEEG